MLICYDINKNLDLDIEYKLLCIVGKINWKWSRKLNLISCPVKYLGFAEKVL